MSKTGGILSQLIEKKDLRIYLELRTKHLQTTMNVEIEKLPEEKRQYIVERYKGRLKELSLLKKLIEQGKLKETDKIYWNQLEKESES